MGFLLSYPVQAPDSDCRLMSFRGDFEENIKRLASLGYDGVELLVRGPERLDLDRILWTVKRCGLEIAAVSPSPMQKQDGLSILNPDKGKSEECVNRLIGLLPFAGEAGAPLVIGKLRGDTSEKAGCTMDRLEEATVRLCEEARGFGARIVLEPQKPDNINNLNGVLETYRWIRSLGRENLGLLADTFHMRATEPSMTESIRQAGSRIWFVHLADEDRRIPFFGDIDFVSVLSALRDSGFFGYLSYEVRQYPSSAEAAELCRSVTRYAEAVLENRV